MLRGATWSWVWFSDFNNIYQRTKPFSIFSFSFGNIKMKSFRWLFFLMLLGVIAFSVHAQSKILKLNGRTIDIKSYSLKGDWLFYVKQDDVKEKLRKMERFDVFSVLTDDGTEEIIYDPDTVNEGDPTVEQVRRYIMGEWHGMQMYHPPWTKPAGVAAGIGSGFIGFYGPPFIFGYALVAGAIPVKKIPPSDTIDPVVFNSDEFITGYRRFARNKKMRDGLIWGGIAFAVSFPTFYLIFHNK
jgi:hypothetical protein